MTGELMISGRWLKGRGETFVSTDPASDATVWSGNAASPQDVESAVQAARVALVPWNAIGFEKRAEIAHRFAQRLADYKVELAELISRETGKPLWESQSEVESMRGKVPASIEAYE